MAKISSHKNKATPAPRPQTDMRSTIRNHLLQAGFDAVGFSPPIIAKPARQRLKDFLAKGYHGDMGWLAAHPERRLSPLKLMPEAQTIIMVASNYGPDHNPMDNLIARQSGNISVYARHLDYHQIMKKRLKAAGKWLADHYGCPIKIFVDTAPVLEKHLAQKAGIGWQGKHTNLVAREWGSWLFLGEIFTSLAIRPDPPEQDHCGSCTACLSICPTKAFPAPYRLDSRRCISYLTIEHKGVIPRPLRKAIGNRIYGCDDCLAVCPWNKFARQTTEAGFAPRLDLTLPRLQSLAELDDQGFRHLFAQSPIKRMGRNRFLRNVMIAIGNSQSRALIPSVEPRLQDDSPLVRGAAVWALSQLVAQTEFRTHQARYAPRETETDVIAEWQAAYPRPR